MTTTTTTTNYKYHCRLIEIDIILFCLNDTYLKVCFVVEIFQYQINVETNGTTMMICNQIFNIILIIMFKIIINQNSIHSLGYKENFNTFIGDQTIWNYLIDLCQQNENNKTISIIVIENFHYYPVDQQNDLSSSSSLMSDWRSSGLVSNFLQHHHCKYELFNNYDAKTLLSTIKIRNKQLSFNNWLLIFNMISSDQLNMTMFEYLLESMGKIYVNCTNCLPLIGIFSQSIHDLTGWFSENSIKKLNQKLRLTLISNNDDDHPNYNNQIVIHFRPVLDGCKLYDGIYLPKTKFDFDRMKISYKQCNLNKSLIKIAINDVSKKVEIFEK